MSDPRSNLGQSPDSIPDSDAFHSESNFPSRNSLSSLGNQTSGSTNTNSGSTYRLLPHWTLDGFDLLDPKKLLEFCKKQDPPLDHGPFYGRANSFTLTRGRHPSHGSILIQGSKLSQLAAQNPEHRLVHTLRITDGSQSTVIRNLAITRTQPIGPSIEATEIHDPTAAYLVELVDARFYAGSYSSLNGDANYRSPDCLLRSNKSWSQILTEIWETSLGGFMGPLQFDANNNYPSLGPEQLRTQGVSAWEVFLKLLDIIGGVIGPNLNGPGYIVYAPSANFSDKVNVSRLLNAASSFLADTEGQRGRFHLPSTIKVLFPSRDYQWWKTNCEDPTPPDFWKYNPLRSLTIATLPFVPLQKRSPDPTVPNTTRSIMAHLPYMTDEQGKVKGAAQMIIHAKSLVRDYVEAAFHMDQFRGHTFNGVWPRFQPGPTWSGVSFFDIGSGIFTRLFSRPRHFNPGELNFTSTDAYNFSPKTISNPASEVLGPPLLERPSHPHHRRIYGYVMGPKLFEYAKSICNEETKKQWVENPEGVKPGKSARVLVLRSEFGKDDGGEPVQKWKPVCYLDAWNALDRVVPWTSRVICDYNHQADGCGVWQIISWQNEPADVQECCIEQVFETTFGKRVINPQLITVRRDSSLRLVWREDGPCLPEAIIDIAPGPPGTIFTSRSPLLPPRWSYDPEIAGSMKVGGWYKLSDGPAWIGPAINHNRVALRLPENKARTGMFLGASRVKGDCVQSAWFGPGLNSEFSFVGYPKGDCGGSASCITLRFKNGLLIGGTVSGSLPPENTDISCIDDPCRDYDPCIKAVAFPGDSPAPDFNSASFQSQGVPVPIQFIDQSGNVVPPACESLGPVEIGEATTNTEPDDLPEEDSPDSGGSVSNVVPIELAAQIDPAQIRANQQARIQNALARAPRREEPDPASNAPLANFFFNGRNWEPLS